MKEEENFRTLRSGAIKCGIDGWIHSKV